MIRNISFRAERRLFVAFTSLALSILMFTAVFASAPQTNGPKEQFEAKLSDLLGVKVTAEDYKLEYATIHLTNILISDKTDGKTFASIQKISATTDFMSLLGGHLIMKDINIDKAQINLSAHQFRSLKKYKPSADQAQEEKRKINDLPFLKLSGKNIKINIKDKESDSLISAIIKQAEFLRKKNSDMLNAGFAGSISAQSLSKPVKKQFNGQLSGNAEISGYINEPQFSGSADLIELKVEKELFKQPLSLPKASFSFNNDEIKTRDLKISWGNSKIRIENGLMNLTNNELNINYSIKPLAFGEISTAFISKNGLTISGIGTSEGNITGSNKNIKINGNLSIPECNINAPLENSKQQNVYTFPFKKVAASYSYNGKTILINNAGARIFGGRLKGKGKIFPRTSPVNFSMNLNGTGLKVEQFLSENSSQKKVVTGTANAEFNANGNSSGLKSMQGNGSFKMLNGHYQAPPVVTPVLSMLNLRQFSSGDIESGKGSFKLKNGIMNTNDLLFIAKAGKVYYRGQVGLDTSLSGKMSIIFDHSAVSRSRVLQEISLDGNIAKIPTRVEGTLLSPSFPGLSAEKLLELGLKRKGQKMIQDILLPGRKKNDSTQTENQQEQKRPEQQLLEGLQNIFKQKTQPSDKQNKTPDNKPDQDKEEPERLEDKLKNIFKF